MLARHLNYFTCGCHAFMQIKKFLSAHISSPHSYSEHYVKLILSYKNSDSYRIFFLQFPASHQCQTGVMKNLAFLNAVLNTASRAIYGCLRPTKVQDLYLLYGIAPPHIRGKVSSQMEKTKQENNPLHSLYDHKPAKKRLKSRHSFLHSTESLNGTAHNWRMTLWTNHLQVMHKLSSSPKESLPWGLMGHGPPGHVWIASGQEQDAAKSLCMQKRGYNDDGQMVYDCGKSRQWNTCWCAPTYQNPVPLKIWKGLTSRQDHVSSTGRVLCSDPRRRSPSRSDINYEQF